MSQVSQDKCVKVNCVKGTVLSVRIKGAVSSVRIKGTVLLY